MNENKIIPAPDAEFTPPSTQEVTQDVAEEVNQKTSPEKIKIAHGKKFSVEQYPHEEKLFPYKSVMFNPGVTVLVGCNGAGKSTLLRQVIETISNDKKANRSNPDAPIGYCEFNNLIDGGTASASRDLYHNNIESMVTKLTSSEGETIIANIGDVAQKMGAMIRGKNHKEVWIFLDAIDSGLSINNIYDIKKYLFTPALKDAESRGVALYIVTVANTFELACDADCIDVQTGKHKKFKTYSSYEKFILKSAFKKYGSD